MAYFLKHRVANPENLCFKQCNQQSEISSCNQFHSTSYKQLFYYFYVSKKVKKNLECTGFPRYSQGLRSENTQTPVLSLKQDKIAPKRWFSLDIYGLKVCE